MRIWILGLMLLTGCSSVFYQPDPYMYFPPEAFGFEKKDLYFESSDGTGLHAWFFAAKGSPKGTIVQFHGNAENISSHYLSLVWLVNEGYNLFSIDYRGYGESRGRPDREGIRKDALVALDQAFELHRKSQAKKFIVYGQSLGGAIVMDAFLDWPHQEQTQLIVMDSTFSSYKSVARRALKNHWLTWLFSPLGYLFVSDEHAPRHRLGELKTRLLVIHDKNDPVVTYQNGLDLFDLANNQKEFWSTDYGLHIGIFARGHTDQRNRFLKFLSEL